MIPTAEETESVARSDHSRIDTLWFEPVIHEYLSCRAELDVEACEGYEIGRSGPRLLLPILSP